jgi:hypothetical protein
VIVATDVIRRGKAGKPNEFGKMVNLQEAENQIVIDFEVSEQRPIDSHMLIPSIEAHEAKLGSSSPVSAVTNSKSRRNSMIGCGMDPQCT